MRTITCLLLLCLWCPPVMAGSAVYRCVGAAGETVFSQTDCGVGAVTFEQAGAQAIGEGLRPSERARLRQFGSSSPVARSTPGKTGASRSGEAEKKQRYRCTRTRQQLDAVQAERRRGYPAGKGRTLRERQARLEAYLDSFCS